MKYVILFSLSVLILTSCTTATNTIPLETLRHDTLYINKETYDSTCIYVEHWQEYHPSIINPESLTANRIDTIFIKDLSVEYRYRLHNDTIVKSRIDSIPYEVRIKEIQEVKYIPPWYKWLSAIGAIAVLLLASDIFKRMK